MPIAVAAEVASAYKVVGRGVDTLVLNACAADENDKPMKQELVAGLQAQLAQLQEEARTRETAIITPWSFRAFVCICSQRGRVASGNGY